MKREERNWQAWNHRCYIRTQASVIFREACLKSSPVLALLALSHLFSVSDGGDWRLFFSSLLNAHVLRFISCQGRSEDVLKTTVSTMESDSVKRNSAFSAKPRRPLIYTIKWTAKNPKKWHCSAQKLLVRINKNLGCSWWLAVFQNLTKFQNGNNQAVMSMSPWCPNIISKHVSTHH